MKTEPSCGKRESSWGQRPMRTSEERKTSYQRAEVNEDVRKRDGRRENPNG